jgi:uridine phosphorylase
MNAEADDFVGNGGRGRFVFLPGSDGRAARIAERFSALRVRKHPRAHNLYLGTLPTPVGTLDVACISTGMGGGSIDIVVNELWRLGARRFLRVGTAGSLQPGRVRAGALVVPTAVVRDEGTSRRYLPVEVPATPSIDVLMAARDLAHSKSSPMVFFGITHSKDSLYAREFGAGPQAPENARYMELMRAGGVLASEMECATLFTLRAVWDGETPHDAPAPQVGAVLAVVGDDEPFADARAQSDAIERAIEFALALAVELDTRDAAVDARDAAVDARDAAVDAKGTRP